MSLPAITMVAAAPLMSSRSKSLGRPCWALLCQMFMRLWMNDWVSAAEAWMVGCQFELD